MTAPARCLTWVLARHPVPLVPGLLGACPPLPLSSSEAPLQLCPVNHQRILSLETLQWRHKERDGVSNHQLYDCLLNRLLRRKSKKTPKIRVTGLSEGNSPVTKGQWRGKCFHLMTSSWRNAHHFFTGNIFKCIFAKEDMPIIIRAILCLRGFAECANPWNTSFPEMRRLVTKCVKRHLAEKIDEIYGLVQDYSISIPNAPEIL